jgi:predicted phosphodiesterase
MRILILSDIHANLTALETVLADAGEIDAAWCLGDLVGYGPDPNECIALVSTLPGLVCVLGNHDAATLERIDASTFNPEAQQAIQWTQTTLTPGSQTFLQGLPEKMEVDGVTLAHGSPRQPVWEYLLDPHNATRSFAHFQTPFCFVGHTHLPVIYHLGDKQRMARMYLPEAEQRALLAPRAILNPGSVGQPRDRDPRAAYAIYDSEELSWHYHRIAYRVSEVQERMRAAGLPDRHIQRLSGGW